MRPTPQTPDDRFVQQRQLTLIGILLGLFLAALDQTIVSTALPRIVADLSGTELYAWVTTAYLLASTVSAPIFGRLTELFSRKAVLLVAVVVFLLGSALCGLAQNMPQLIVFRGLQGIGGGALFALALTTIAVLFPPRERGRVGGLFGAVFGVSSAVGPWLGGVLTDHLSWHWVFYINMPVGVVALAFILRYMPRLSPERREPFDFLGAFLLALWTVPLMLAFSWGGSTYPWLSAPILGLFVLSALSLVLWVWSQNRQPHPLFDLSLLRVRTFSLASAATFFFGPAFLGAVAFLPLYLQVVKGVSASASGVTVLPLTLGVVLGASSSGVLSGRMGRFKPLLLVGTLWLLATFLTLHFLLSVETPLWLAVLFFFLLGLGLGPAQSLLQIAAQNNVPPERLGSATAFTQLMRQIGSTIGIALLGTVLTHHLTAETCRVFPENASCKPGALVQRSEGAAGLNLDEQFARLEAQLVAALKGDVQAYEALMQDAQVPSEVKGELVKGGIPAQFARLERLMVATLKGDEGAYAELMRDPSLPEEYKAKLVKGGIPARFHALERLLVAALKGDSQAYWAVQQDPQVPAEFKSRIPQGGVAAQVRARVQQTLGWLEAALQGNEQAKQALLATPGLDPRLRGLLDNPPPAEARPMVLAQVGAALEDQVAQAEAAATQQAIVQLRAELARAQARALEQALSSLREGLRKAQAAALDKTVQTLRESLAAAEQKALEEVPQQVVERLEETKRKLHEALNQGITNAERDIFLYAALFVLVSFGFVVGLPNEELRGRVAV
ncbi:MAG: DHA2 family efflux MFS transporter permease subunit [Deinococcus-Thermus bacterium]|nr:MAG: DHA2 family efflux MFS transporter permease subunit [Deinococcota bacterium]